MSFLRIQYDLVKAAREVVFSHFAAMPQEALLKPVPEFNNKTVMELSVHIHNVYIHWLGNYALRENISYKDERIAANLNRLKELFCETDKLAENFLNYFDGGFEAEIANRVSGKEVKSSPLEVFTHVFTHEFHHKGQIMSMCRMLGYTPPDTDVIRT